VVVSPTPDATHPELAKELAAAGVPLLRGLRAGLAAVRSLSLASPMSPADELAVAASPLDKATIRAFEDEIRRHDGGLPTELSQRLLSSYGVSFVSSMLVRSADDPAIDKQVAFPVVVKVSSVDVPHRSEVGGVRMGIDSPTKLREAIAQIERGVRAAYPRAVIDGYEIQEEMTDCVEGLVGFKIARPFGPLTMVGTGGTLAELQADRSVALGAIAPRRAGAMISSTRLGKVLAGYRNLVPETSLEGLATLISRLAWLAQDLASVLSECDLNPVLIRKGSGEAKAADVLMVAARR
jgi:acyl-CoA synthetase (NDP forming)